METKIKEVEMIERLKGWKKQTNERERGRKKWREPCHFKKLHMTY